MSNTPVETQESIEDQNKTNVEASGSQDGIENLRQDQLQELEELLKLTPTPSTKNNERIKIGTIVEVNKKQEMCVVDFSLKSEAIIPLSEFTEYDEETKTYEVPEVNIGDEFEFYIESFETEKSVVMASRSKVKKEKTWQKIVQCFKANTIIEGIVFARMKGGFCVDFDGNLAFLPASQARINFATKGSEIIGNTQPFKVVNIDETYQTGIVSYLAAREEVMADKKQEFLESITEGDIVDGVVKSITNYGAFVDLGGIMDGLLHISDIVWNRISHPSEILEVGEKYKLKIIKIDQNTKRLSLGLKQLTKNPNEHLKDKYKPGDTIVKKVTNITDYGIFVEIEPGIEGLIHIYEIDWSKNRSQEFLGSVSVGDEVPSVILSIDVHNSNKILLSRKQTIENPWKKFIENTKIGTHIEGVVKKVESFRLIVSVGEGISGVVQIEDISWIAPSEEDLAQYSEGQKITVAYLSGQYDERQPRINLGIKQLTESPIEKYKDQLQPDCTITGTVSAIDFSKIELKVFEIFKAHIKKAHISSSKTEQRSNRFAIGDKISAKVLKFNEDNGMILASIRKIEEEEKETMLAKYGDADSGATIGNIIGDALKIPTAQPSAEDPKESNSGEDQNKGE